MRTSKNLNINKGFALPLILFVIVLLVFSGLIIFIVNSKSSNTKTPIVKNSGKIISDYGFSMTLAVSWKVWEGPSAGSSIVDEPDFETTIEKYYAAKDNGKSYPKDIIDTVNRYQKQVNNWKVESANYFEISNSDVDYNNRDLRYIGKILSSDIGNIDSLDYLKINRVGVLVSSEPMPNDKVETNAENVSKRYIDINQKKALLAIAKQNTWKITELVRIYYPIELTSLVRGELVKTLRFTTLLKQGDTKAEDDFVKLISQLNITNN